MNEVILIVLLWGMQPEDNKSMAVLTPNRSACEELQQEVLDTPISDFYDKDYSGVTAFCADSFLKEFRK